MVKSAERALDILELLRQSGPLKFKDISAALGMPKSSTSMLLNGMVRKGYLVLDCATHLYRRTYRVALLGEGIEGKAILGEGALLDTLARFHYKDDEVLLIGLRNGAYVQYIHAQSGTIHPASRLPVGHLHPLAYDPLGKVLLARLADPEVRLIVRHNNAMRHDPLPRATEAGLCEQIGAIRKHGYLVDRGGAWIEGTYVAMSIQLAPDLPALAVAIGSACAAFGTGAETLAADLSIALAAWRA